MKRTLYVSRAHGCKIYSQLFFIESKAIKQLHSGLHNSFSNATFNTNLPLEICNRTTYNFRQNNVSR